MVLKINLWANKVLLTYFKNKISTATQNIKFIDKKKKYLEIKLEWVFKVENEFILWNGVKNGNFSQDIFFRPMFL